MQDLIEQFVKAKLVFEKCHASDNVVVETYEYRSHEIICQDGDTVGTDKPMEKKKPQ